ncbi:MAG TPA: hypothetical protein VN408_34235 [Actinoplanes sp.]|nr:hypothetical protein [Actinoplanes sp.]
MILLNEPIGVGTVAGFALGVTGCWLSTRPSHRVLSGSSQDPQSIHR